VLFLAIIEQKENVPYNAAETFELLEEGTLLTVDGKNYAPDTFHSCIDSCAPFVPLLCHCLCHAHSNISFLKV
jgi:hypothetical protein